MGKYIYGFNYIPATHNYWLRCHPGVGRQAYKNGAFMPSPHITFGAEQWARAFVDNVVRPHGIPKSIVSDRDSRFTGHFWTAVCKLLDIKQAMSTSFHPQTDGQTERANRTLEDMLRHYINPSQNDWDQHLAAIEFAISIYP